MNGDDAPPAALSSLPPELLQLIAHCIQRTGLLKHRGRPAEKTVGDTLSLLAFACTCRPIHALVRSWIITEARHGDGFTVQMDVYEGPWTWDYERRIGPQLAEWFWVRRLLTAMRWIGVAELRFSHFRRSGDQIAREVVRFLRGPMTSRLPLVIRLVDNEMGSRRVQDGFDVLESALRGGLAPNLTLLDVSGCNYLLHRTSMQTFVEQLVRRARDVEFGPLRVLHLETLDIDDHDAECVDIYQQLLLSFPESLSRRPFLDDEVRAVSREARRGADPFWLGDDWFYEYPPSLREWVNEDPTPWIF